jgi:hypothetical protein
LHQARRSRDAGAHREQVLLVSVRPQLGMAAEQVLLLSRLPREDERDAVVLEYVWILAARLDLNYIPPRTRQMADNPPEDAHRTGDTHFSAEVLHVHEGHATSVVRKQVNNLLANFGLKRFCHPISPCLVRWGLAPHGYYLKTKNRGDLPRTQLFQVETSQPRASQTGE